ncbi:MAG TPA: hypothetical protein VES02_14410 [Dermatophilaceae bacterium]|nr:hypothetical protein [Dermatophilaceae bacterium]
MNPGVDLNASVVLIADLQKRLRGRLVGPADEDYDEVRAVWNGMVDKRPRLIARV